MDFYILYLVDSKRIFMKLSRFFFHSAPDGWGFPPSYM